jgi:hypothetical protein
MVKYNISSAQFILLDITLKKQNINFAKTKQPFS